MCVGRRIVSRAGAASGASYLVIVTMLGTMACASSAGVATGRAAGRQPQRDAAARQAGGLTIRTLAGGLGGPAAAATVSIAQPCGVTSAGKTLLVGTEVAHAGVLREVSETTGRLTNLAGVPLPGTSPDGTLAGNSQFVLACDTALDHAGNLVFSDSAFVDAGFRQRTGNYKVRVLAMHGGTFYGQKMIKGRIYTIGGNGTFGNIGDGHPATAAQIGIPVGVALDSAGNVVVATAFPSGRIRVIAAATGTFYGQAMTAGDIYTVAGGGAAQPCAPGAADGQPATSVDLGLATMKIHRDQLEVPAGLRIDHSGNIVISAAECGGRIRVIATRNGRFYGRQMASAHIYTIAGGGTAAPGNGGLATNAQLGRLGGLALDRAGNVVIADTIAHSVRLVAARSGRFYGQQMVAGHIYTLAGGHGAGSQGDGGPAIRAKLDFPWAVAVDGRGNIAIADSMNLGVRVIAADSGPYYGRQMRAGDIYTVAGNGQWAFSGDGGPATAATFGSMEFSTALFVAPDQAGDLLISDPANGRVRFLPASAGVFFGRRLQAHHLYSLAGSKPVRLLGPDCAGSVPGSHALLPCDIAADRAGNAVLTTPKTVSVIAVRTGRFYGQAMRAGDVSVIAGGGKSTANGVLATQASLFPRRVAVDSHGNVVTVSGKIRVIAATTGTFYGLHMRAGHIYSLGYGDQVASADLAGNLIVICRSRVCVIAGRNGTFYGRNMMAGHEYVVAGDGSRPTSGDGGPALAAGMSPWSVAVDGSGNLIIYDTNFANASPVRAEVRVVAAQTGTFYDQAMTSGDIYRVAGGGSAFIDGPAFRAEVAGAGFVAAAPGGGILLAENLSGKICLIS